MKTIKRTYVLPAEAATTGLLREWVELQQREQTRRDMIEGCREMAGIYQEIEREYHPLEEEVQHTFGD